MICLSFVSVFVWAVLSCLLIAFFVYVMWEVIMVEEKEED